MSDPDNGHLSSEPLSTYQQDHAASKEPVDEKAGKEKEAADHLSPAPLHSYEATTDMSQESSGDAQNTSPDRDAAEPFRKIDLENQKKYLGKPRNQYNLTPNGMERTNASTQRRAFDERQISDREQVLASLQDQARDDFNTAHVAGPFARGELNQQKASHSFDERQIEHREKVFESLQDKARDDFTLAHNGRDQGLER